MANKRYTSVPKKFDDQLEALIAFAAGRGATGIVDVETLAKDLAAQRTDYQRDLELARQAAGFHASFGVAQAARYARFMKALQLLRVAYGDDPDARRALEQFKRRRRRNGSGPAASGDAEVAA